MDVYVMEIKFKVTMMLLVAIQRGNHMQQSNIMLYVLLVIIHMHLLRCNNKECKYSKAAVFLQKQVHYNSNSVMKLCQPDG